MLPESVATISEYLAGGEVVERAFGLDHGHRAVLSSHV